MAKTVTILKGHPTIVPVAEMQLNTLGIEDMMEWVRVHRPECLPAPEEMVEGQHWLSLFPHEGMEEPNRMLTANELLVELAGRKCFDAQTEVLTASGWVAFPQLRRGEAVACFSEQRGEIVFETPTAYIEKQHKGEMYCVESRALSMRVTPDHDMYHRRSSGVWIFKEAQELLGHKYGIRRAAFFPGGDFVEEFWPVLPEQAHAWASLLGYYLSEGSFVHGVDYGTGSRAVIYQHESGCAPILEAIKALGLDDPYVKIDTRNSVAAITLNNTRLAEALAEACGRSAETKRIPRHVFSWSFSLRAALLDALMFGDGSLQRGGHRVYRSVSEQLAADVQQLILMSGRPGSISYSDHALRTPYPTSFKSNFPIFSVREGDQTVVTVNNKAQHDWMQQDVDEPVYCVTVPSRILILRRNRKVFFCSNCYDSFGLKAGRKSNREYIENTQAGDIPHASIMYHAKMSFFFAGISRRVSHEIIRNYVGADRSEEGNPSQESTRFTHHYGYFICPPRYLAADPADHFLEVEQHFERSMQQAYDNYLYAVDWECKEYERQFHKPPTGMDKKRIYEAASSFLPHQAETSFIWTTNPAAIAKFVRERDNPVADLEIQRFARTWKRVCVRRWPNLFPQAFMKE